MTSNNSKLSIRVQGDIRERLSAFQAEHQLKSLSGAIGVILEKYFSAIASVPSAGEGAEDLPPAEPDDLPFPSAVTNTLLKRIEKLETRLFTEEQERKELEIRLAATEAELGNYRRSTTTQGSLSVKPIQESTKPHNPIYGRGEAASIYPGWELSANVSYVFSRFQTLNTDEARAAFADKWIGLCAQSLDTAWVVCYQLLSIIKEKQMYKIPQWMEGNKTYDSFSDYFEQRFKQPFEKWSQLERTYKFVVENCRELLLELLHVESNPDFSLTVETQNDSGNGMILSNTKRKTANKRNQKLPQPEAQPEKPQETAETAPTPETTSPIQKDSDDLVTPEAQKLETQESTSSAPLPKTMTTREIAQLLNWHRDKLEARKKRGNLPIQEGGYLIDCIGKKSGKLIWSVERLE